MELLVVDYQGRPSTNPLSLVRVGDDCVVRKVDDLIQWLLRSLPTFTHENTVDILLNYKIVKLI